jgi:tetratricopeptide (TPR) repeat protein
VSPHSGLAVATRFGVEWEKIGSYAADQEARSQSPDVLEALAQHWDQARKPNAALRCWRKRVAMSPDASALLHLAEAQERAGDLDGWLETLGAYFEKTPGGRDHAALETKAARRLLDAGHPEKAIPHAVAAAEREEEAALLCAAECFERTGDLAGAERWVKRLSECYAARGTDWFTWCKRTGVGDVEAARLWGESFAKTWSESTDPGTVVHAARFYLLAGETKKALRAARIVAEGRHDPFFGLHVAILSMVADRRETALEDVVENGAGAPSLVLLGRVLAPCLEHAERLDESAVEAVRAQADRLERARLEYLVGIFLESRSRPDAARAHYERCLAEDESDGELPEHALARDGLKRLDSSK